MGILTTYTINNKSIMPLAAHGCQIWISQNLYTFIYLPEHYRPSNTISDWLVSWYVHLMHIPNMSTVFKNSETCLQFSEQKQRFMRRLSCQLLWLTCPPLHDTRVLSTYWEHRDVVSSTLNSSIAEQLLKYCTCHPFYHLHAHPYMIQECC